MEQLRSLLVEQARSLAAQRIHCRPAGRPTGRHPAGRARWMCGRAWSLTPSGNLLLDETLSDLDDHQAGELLKAGRESPLVIVQDAGELFVGTVIPTGPGGIHRLARPGRSRPAGPFRDRQPGVFLLPADPGCGPAGQPGRSGRRAGHGPFRRAARAGQSAGGPVFRGSSPAGRAGGHGTTAGSPQRQGRVRGPGPALRLHRRPAPARFRPGCGRSVAACG